MKRVYDEYGYLTAKDGSKELKKQMKLCRYTEERVYTLLRKLMRNGAALMDAQHMVMTSVGPAMNQIGNEDYNRKFKREERERKHREAKAKRAKA